MSKTKKIAIIGAGQLGSRHLQALSKLKKETDLFIIDPFLQSLDTAKARYQEMPFNPAIKAINFYQSINEVPSEIDYCVISTTADVRFSVLNTLLNQSKVQYMLLEKVLFQVISEYHSAQEILNRKKVKAWVNCTRRVFEVYTKIKCFFSNDVIKHVDLYGGDWGLGCNGIHEIDVIAFLAGKGKYIIDASRLDKSYKQSKRPRFIEFTGSISGHFDGGPTFNISSIANSSATDIMVIHGENKACLINERQGIVLFNNPISGLEWKSESFKIPYTSESGLLIAEEVLETGTCKLPTYEESMQLHIPFILALKQHYSALDGRQDGLPIT
jgi:predicted dehydrogenase